MTAYDIEMEALPTALIHYQEVIALFEGTSSSSPTISANLGPMISISKYSFQGPNYPRLRHSRGRDPLSCSSGLSFVQGRGRDPPFCGPLHTRVSEYRIALSFSGSKVPNSPRLGHSCGQNLPGYGSGLPFIKRVQYRLVLFKAQTPSKFDMVGVEILHAMVVDSPSYKGQANTVLPVLLPERRLPEPSSSLFSYLYTKYLTLIENLDQDHFWVPASRSRVLSQSRSPTPVRRSRCDRAMPQILEIHFYVTGLPSRVTEKDLEIHFSKEGKIAE
ncbi:hypothetical protein ZIOFF_061266 [Zingiber officinale]|uniref:RRM domain-containing protein n=1 Tax=Zingiber officinale TaxID=94328 RepID=A0A8J5F3S6_ZINOF|nr:hypothetical protein ZIOFF_061266 [Zingiber officinale]